MNSDVYLQQNIMPKQQEENLATTSMIVSLHDYAIIMNLPLRKKSVGSVQNISSKLTKLIKGLVK